MELISGCPGGGKGKREEQKLIGHFQAPFFRHSEGCVGNFRLLSWASLLLFASSYDITVRERGKEKEDEVCVGTARKRDSYTSLLLAVERGIEEKSGWDRRKSVGAENEGIFFSIPLSSFLSDGRRGEKTFCLSCPTPSPLSFLVGRLFDTSSVRGEGKEK